MPTPVKHLFLNDEPGVSGSGAPAPAPAEPPAPAPAEPTQTPAPSPAPEPFSALTKALDAVGTAEPVAPAAGTPAPAGDTAAAVPAQAAAPAAPAKPAAPKPGEVDLTPPDGMNERSQQRWSQLAERAKQVPDLERRATEATQALDGVRRMVSESGLAAQEFSDMLGMARLYKSGNPQEMRAALQQLDGLRADLATRLGVEVPGIDALASHADLKQKVEGMLMTREDALEIAHLRDQHKRATGQLQATEQEQREYSQFQQTVSQAAASMENTLAARAGTPGHEAKVAYIATHFKDPQNLQRFVTTYQPQQWEAALLMMYDAYSPPAAAPAVPQPLRPGNTRSGAPVRQGPVTAEGAVAGAFARLGL